MIIIITIVMIMIIIMIIIIIVTIILIIIINIRVIRAPPPAQLGGKPASVIYMDGHEQLTITITNALSPYSSASGGTSHQRMHAIHLHNCRQGRWHHQCHCHIWEISATMSAHAGWGRNHNPSTDEFGFEP